MTGKILAMTCAAALAAGTIAGCATKTEGELTREKAKQLDSAADLITRGDAQIEQGKATEARGRAAKDHGDTVEGNRLIAEGQAMQKKGEADKEAGRKLKSGM